MKVNDLIKSAKIRIPAILKSASDIILKPIFAYPGFVAALTLLGAISPLAMLTTGQIFFHFIFYALTQSFAVAYLLAWVAYAVKHRWFRIAVICLVATFAIFEAGQIALTERPSDLTSITLILETNPREVSGFFTQYLTTGAILKFTAVFIVSVLVIYGFKRLICLILSKNNLFTNSILLIITISGLIFGYIGIVHCSSVLTVKDSTQLIIWEGTGNKNEELVNVNRIKQSDLITKNLYLAKSLSIENGEFNNWKLRQNELIEQYKNKVALSHNSPDNINIVVVIGESFIKSHSSIYGYYLPTSPKLEKELSNNLLVKFNDIITSANFTSQSLSNLFNLNDVSDSEKWTKSIFWPILFKFANFDVNFYSNQINIRHNYLPTSGMLYHHPLFVDKLYSHVNDTTMTYDGDFIDYYANFSQENNRSLTFWHLMGQHFAAKDRYPSKDDAYTKISIDQIKCDKPWITSSHKQQICDYANATIYNDSIVSTIINFYRESPTILVYFSDHGEEIWDIAPYGVRNNPQPEDPDWIKRQFDIPFFVWMSRPFREAYPDIVAKVEAAKDRPGMLDNLGQMLLGVAGIQTEYYRSDRDILSDDYVARPRVTEAGYEYDRIVNSD